MSFSVGIIGLPNAGKSTLFKALTRQAVTIAPRPFTTIHPNKGIVVVPDKRLEKVSAVIGPEKTTPTTIEFIDIAGLVKNAWQGEGLGNQFLGQIRNCDALLEIVRSFENETIEHVEKSLDPQRDQEIIKTELLMKDLETLEKAIDKPAKKTDTIQKKVQLLRRIKDGVAEGIRISEIELSYEEKKAIKEFQFLTAKPIIFVLNTGSKNVVFENEKAIFLKINLKFEQELSELSDQEAEEIAAEGLLSGLILRCYQILDLITFYTITGGKEVRAWTVARGAKAPEAGGVVHTDFEKRFIRAEVINWQKLVTAENWKTARESGSLKVVGRDYLIQDGDVIEFKI